jgi:hypothetical protein
VNRVLLDTDIYSEVIKAINPTVTQKFAAFAHEQHVGNFERPEGGHGGPSGRQGGPHGIGVGRSFVLEIPGHRDRAIDY